ncbi:MAG: hypothetical protein KF851_03190 [Pirellulaceae bacterium]|nr:hypothetical protein [Pirellulaceae bacterium]
MNPDQEEEPGQKEVLVSPLLLLLLVASMLVVWPLVDSTSIDSISASRSTPLPASRHVDLLSRPGPRFKFQT